MKRDAGAMILLTRLESCHTALQSKAQEEPDKSGTSVCNIWPSEMKMELDMDSANEKISIGWILIEQTGIARIFC